MTARTWLLLAALLAAFLGTAALNDPADLAPINPPSTERNHHP